MEKRECFKQVTESKKVQAKIKDCKMAYKYIWIRLFFGTSDTRSVWQGVQTITGYKPQKRNMCVQNDEDETVYANDLKEFTAGLTNTILAFNKIMLLMRCTHLHMLKVLLSMNSKVKSRAQFHRAA